MKDYTPKEMKTLQSNPYTLKVTKHKLYFTKEFKKQFWITYEAGVAPRQILKDFGYDLDMFGQKQIDSIVQAIKRQANSPYGFSEGENRQRRAEVKDIQHTEAKSEYLDRILNEVKYLRQEVDFLKKLVKEENAPGKKY
ncbi:MAG: HTH domain-containing protein [Cellulosilyticaceae bacterium]